MNRVFSTRELAALCGVNESTIKRWADSGRLDCVKTPGGHRKFRAQDVYNFLNQHGYDTSMFGAALSGALPGAGGASVTNLDAALAGVVRLPPEVAHAISTRAPGPLIEAYLAAARDGGYRTVRQILMQLLAARWSAVDICEDIIAPALESVGNRWSEGKLSIMQEHLISATTLESLALIAEEMPRREPNGRRALCCGGESDQHSLGIRMSALALESNGWSVSLSLSTIPVDEVCRYLEESRPDLLCVSLVFEPAEGSFMTNYGRLREAARASGTRMALGGRGSGNGTFVEADFRGRSLRELVRWTESVEWPGRGNSPPSAHAGPH